MGVGLGVAPQLVSLVYALLYASVIYGLVWLLWRRRIFVRL